MYFTKRWETVYCLARLIFKLDLFMINKMVVDGKVAVLVSPGYGAGWSTWAQDDAAQLELMFNAQIVQAVIDGENTKAAEIATAKFPDFYTGGAGALCVMWITQGVAFRIDEDDGFESIEFFGDDQYFVA